MATQNDFPALYTALAQGYSIQARHHTDDENDWLDQWNWGAGCMSAFVNKGDGWFFRVMPRTIQINGIEVPEPLRLALPPGTVHWMAVISIAGQKALKVDSGEKWFQCWLERGLLHATEEAAIKHAEALLACSAS